MATVALCTPSNRDPKWGYVCSLVNTLAASGEPGDEEIRIGFRACFGSLVSLSRNSLVEMVRDGFSHIFWADDDMEFPPRTIQRLLAHHKPIVACNCTTRRAPVLTTALKNGERVSSASKTGLEEVDSVGMAVALVETALFRDLPKPWFDMPWNEDPMKMGEDLHFCNLARRHGHRIYIDHDLSREIGHVGDVAFNHMMVGQGA